MNNPQYLHATSAIVEFTDGSSVTLSNAEEVRDLYFCVYSSGVPSTMEEGKESASQKLLNMLGGSTEFEISRQRMIVDWLAAAEKPGLKRVLIIGDSIRMRIADSTGYAMHAYRHLSGKVNITHIPHECGGTKSVLANIDNWLSCKPDIVHFNAGLHDLAFYWSGGKPAFYTTIEEYVSNLEIIIKKINRVTNNIIWALNTPVHEEWHKQITSSMRGRKQRLLRRNNSDIQNYNDASMKLMQKYAVDTNDLYSALWNQGIGNMLIQDGVHLSYAGSRLAGQLVAEKILQKS